MDEQQQKDIAVFRFGVISDFVCHDLTRGDKERLLKEKCSRQWQIPHSGRTRLARATILAWLKAYREGRGRLEALYPQPRSDRGLTRSINDESASVIVTLRRQLPRCTVKLLLQELESRKLLKPDHLPSYSSLYRFLKRENLLHPDGPAPVDRRKFEAESPNDIWQSDAMHGPMVMDGEKRRKTYLFAFLDDMSRLVPHAAFYFSENLDCYLDALRSALLKRGLPRKLYTDNGSAFRSKLLQEITAGLGIALVHSRPYIPQGRGKIERWFLTVQKQFLPALSPRLDLKEINENLEQWIRTVYHQRPHSATAQSPIQRFAEKMECIRPAPRNLEDFFRKRARRKVANDRTVALNGKLYEAPVPLIGKQVTLLYHEHDPARVEAHLDNLSYGFLNPLDLQVNCRVRRLRSKDLVMDSAATKTVPSGQLSFHRKEEQL